MWWCSIRRRRIRTRSRWSTASAGRASIPTACRCRSHRSRRRTDEVWKSDTSEELRVPIGRTGAKKLQMLAIGKGTRQHVLVAGKTGSGKSTLFHVIITNLALWCSPGAGRVLSGGLQERRRIQMLRRQTPAARARRRHRERPRIRAQRAAAGGCRVETPRRVVPPAPGRRIWRVTSAPAAPKPMPRSLAADRRVPGVLHRGRRAWRRRRRCC